MYPVFLKLFNMSISAGWLVLAALLFRLAFRKAPKYMRLIVWGLVGIRLLCPFSIKSGLSLIPSAETVPQEIVYAETPAIRSGIPGLNSTLNPLIAKHLSPAAAAEEAIIADRAAGFRPPVEAESKPTPMQRVATAATVTWLLGTAALLSSGILGFFSMRRKMSESIELEKGVILSDNAPAPFILGVFRPLIVLPSSISAEDAACAVAHERAHISRGDNLIKPLAFFMLALHWFNPLVWLAYKLLCNDIELACDERVIKKHGSTIKKAYSTALINCSLPSRRIGYCPLAFGEISVKRRIKNVLKYRKYSYKVSIAAVFAAAIIAVLLLTDPIDASIDLNALSSIGSGAAEQTSPMDELLEQSPIFAPEYHHARGRFTAQYR